MDAENERLKRVRLKKAHAEWWERQIERHERNLKSEARHQARLEEKKRLTSEIFFKDELIEQLKCGLDAKNKELDAKNKELEAKDEQIRQLLIDTKPQSSPTVATTSAKSSKFGETRALRRRLSRQVDVLQVPSVALPCGSSAPERLSIRTKVIMLGDSGVGKTSIVYSAKYGCYSNDLPPFNITIEASHTNFNISVFNNVRVRLHIWDTAGQERFRCMVPMYMRNASAAILVYDITDRDSFNQIDEWHSALMLCPTAVDEPTIVLIGNKADQNNLREVAEGEGVSKVIRSIFNLVAEKIVHKWTNVESAHEADETMFEVDNGGESRGTSSSSSCCSAL